MNKTINLRFMLVAAIAIMMTAILCTFACYRVYKEEVIADLRAYTKLLADTDVVSSQEDESIALYAAELEAENIRMTLIDRNGAVIFDNVADITRLDNHRDREEIEAAIATGEGSSVRRSTTINRTNYYYAIRLPDDSVLRTARASKGILSIFAQAIPLIVGSSFVLFALCFFISRILTQNLLRPIRSMAYDLDHPERIEVYDEMKPIVQYLQKSHEDIIKSAMLRQEFTANVSHELKTPLTSISGYSELIENGMTDETDTRKFAGEIHRNADRLLPLINDILRLSELDTAREMEREREPVDLYDTALTCAAMLEPEANRHGVTIRVEGAHVLVRADKTMMEELVYNLVDNAVRYNHDGGWVLIEAYGDRLTVSDNGIGISKENQKRVFERFFRVDKSRSKKTGGTGLGLAIVKHIVEIHDAQMDIESDEGRGTRITVRFPESK